MKYIVKLSTTVLILASISFFGCKEKVIDPPASLDPIKITLEEFNSGKYLDVTVMIENVFFTPTQSAESNKGQFNGTTSNSNGARTIGDCYGNTAIIHTSPDREFSHQYYKTGMGTIYGVASEYQGTIQLLLRTGEDDDDLTRDHCTIEYPVVTIQDVLDSTVAEGKIVQINNVEFTDISSTWGGSNNIQDCNGKILVSYVASGESFANNAVPPGNGPLIGSILLFGDTWEIKPRSEEDGEKMTNPLCGGGGGGGATACDSAPTTTYLSKDFEDASLTSGGWVSYIAAGTTDWEAASFSGDNYAKITNYAGGSNSAADVWFISPATDLSATTAPELRFTNLAKFNGDALKVLVSTNFAGGDPSFATWTDLTSQADWDVDLADWGSFVCSGNVDLSSYKVADVYVAFQYTGSASDGTTWELDDILIKE